MIDAGDREHAHEIERACGGYSGPAPANQEDAETTQVHDNKRRGAYPVDTVDVPDSAHLAGGVKVSIEPLDH